MAEEAAEFRILSPCAILGYGFPPESFRRGLARDPHLIAVDAGSIDPGPYYLGAGKSFTDRVAVKRDLRYILEAGRERGIPVVVGSCGGAGAEPHLSWCADIVREIAREEGLRFPVGLIYADVARQEVLDAIEGGRISPESPLPPLDAQTVNACEALVAQMGIEPIEEAIRSGCDVILCGRAYDPAVFAAHPVHAGYDKGLAFHLGKILECAAIAADPGSGSDCVLGILREDHFVLEPLSDDRRFTEQSTAAHSLYEKSDPYVLPGPGGRINLSETSFTETGEGTVVVRGSRFEPSDEYYIKLEGVTKKGYRTVSVAGTRDPRMIESVRPILEDVERYSMDLLAKEGIQGSIFFHVYGKDGVMGRLEPETVVRSHELGIVLEAIGATQDQANAICSFVRSALLHYGYPGRISTAGNLAFPFSPSDLQAGAVYEFSVFHLMRIHDQGVFRLQTEELGGST